LSQVRRDTKQGGLCDDIKGCRGLPSSKLCEEVSGGPSTAFVDNSPDLDSVR